MRDLAADLPLLNADQLAALQRHVVNLEPEDPDDCDLATVAELLSSWGRRVQRFEDELDKTLDDPTVWIDHDWQGTLYYRDTLAGVLEQLPDRFRRMAEPTVQAMDAHFQRITQVDEDGLLERLFDEDDDHDVGADWWWRRVPVRGPVLDTLLERPEARPHPPAPLRWTPPGTRNLSGALPLLSAEHLAELQSYVVSLDPTDLDDPPLMSVAELLTSWFSFVRSLDGRLRTARDEPPARIPYDWQMMQSIRDKVADALERMPDRLREMAEPTVRNGDATFERMSEVDRTSQGAGAGPRERGEHPDGDGSPDEDGWWWSRVPRRRLSVAADPQPSESGSHG